MKISAITNFLITCSGADKNTLNQNIVAIEKPKFVSIGAAILLTSTLAAFSGGYALFFSFNSLIASVMFGILWALLIFNLDRYIIISIDKNSSLSRQIVMSIPRILISFVLAITISKPLELRIFEGSINGRLYDKDTQELLTHDSLVSVKKNRLKGELLKIEKQDTKDDILSDYNNTRTSLLKQQELVLNSIRIAGTDTPRVKALTGRLKLVNRQISHNDSLIAKRKKQVYSGIEEIEMLDAGVKRRIYREIFVTDSLYPIQVKEMKDKQSNRDLLIRLKALSELKSADETMNAIGNVITLLFILMEMSPVLVKLMAKKGLYEEAILRKERLFYAPTTPQPVSVAIEPTPLAQTEPVQSSQKEPETIIYNPNINSTDHRPVQRNIMQRGVFPKE